MSESENDDVKGALGRLAGSSGLRRNEIGRAHV